MDTTQTTVDATETTDAPVTNNTQEVQATEEKFYSQKEFDDAMAKMKHATLNKALKPYQDLGDIEELRSLKQQAEQAQQEEQMKRGEFESILKDLASKKDQEIQSRDNIIREYKVDSPILNSAAKYKSVNPEQVKSLLKTNVRLGEEGNVEVIGADGQVRYTDSGTSMGVDDLVKEFLDANPHFVQTTPSTTNTKSSISTERKGDFDASKIDFSDPEQRKQYAEWRNSQRQA